jgi:hypothetical protein
MGSFEIATQHLMLNKPLSWRRVYALGKRMPYQMATRSTSSMRVSSFVELSACVNGPRPDDWWDLPMTFPGKQRATHGEPKRLTGRGRLPWKNGTRPSAVEAFLYHGNGINSPRNPSKTDLVHQTLSPTPRSTISLKSNSTFFKFTSNLL